MKSVLVGKIGHSKLYYILDSTDFKSDAVIVNPDGTTRFDSFASYVIDKESTVTKLKHTQLQKFLWARENANWLNVVITKISIPDESLVSDSVINTDPMRRKSHLAEMSNRGLDFKIGRLSQTADTKALRRIGGGLRRAITPKRNTIGRTIAKFRAIIDGELDPRKRRDMDGDGKIFDGTWREMPDPSLRTPETLEQSNAQRLGSAATTPPRPGYLAQPHSKPIGIIEAIAKELQANPEDTPKTMQNFARELLGIVNSIISVVLTRNVNVQDIPDIDGGPGAGRQQLTQGQRSFRVMQFRKAIQSGLQKMLVRMFLPKLSGNDIDRHTEKEIKRPFTNIGVEIPKTVGEAKRILRQLTPGVEFDFGPDEARIPGLGEISKKFESSTTFYFLSNKDNDTLLNHEEITILSHHIDTVLSYGGNKYVNLAYVSLTEYFNMARKIYQHADGENVAIRQRLPIHGGGIIFDRNPIEIGAREINDRRLYAADAALAKAHKIVLNKIKEQRQQNPRFNLASADPLRMLQITEDNIFDAIHANMPDGFPESISREAAKIIYVRINEAVQYVVQTGRDIGQLEHVMWVNPTGIYELEKLYSPITNFLNSAFVKNRSVSAFVMNETNISVKRSMGGVIGDTARAKKPLIIFASRNAKDKMLKKESDVTDYAMDLLYGQMAQIKKKIVLAYLFDLSENTLAAQELRKTAVDEIKKLKTDAEEQIKKLSLSGSSGSSSAASISDSLRTAVTNATDALTKLLSETETRESDQSELQARITRAILDGDIFHEGGHQRQWLKALQDGDRIVRQEAQQRLDELQNATTPSDIAEKEHLEELFDLAANGTSSFLYAAFPWFISHRQMSIDPEYQYSRWSQVAEQVAIRNLSDIINNIGLLGQNIKNEDVIKLASSGLLGDPVISSLVLELHQQAQSGTRTATGAAQMLDTMIGRARRLGSTVLKDSSDKPIYIGKQQITKFEEDKKRLLATLSKIKEALIVRDTDKRYLYSRLTLIERRVLDKQIEELEKILRDIENLSSQVEATNIKEGELGLGDAFNISLLGHLERTIATLVFPNNNDGFGIGGIAKDLHTNREGVYGLLERLKHFAENTQDSERVMLMLMRSISPKLFIESLVREGLSDFFDQSDSDRIRDSVINLGIEAGIALKKTGARTSRSLASITMLWNTNKFWEVAKYVQRKLKVEGRGRTVNPDRMLRFLTDEGILPTGATLVDYSKWLKDNKEIIDFIQNQSQRRGLSESAARLYGLAPDYAGNPSADPQRPLQDISDLQEIDNVLKRFDIDIAEGRISSSRARPDSMYALVDSMVGETEDSGITEFIEIKQILDENPSIAEKAKKLSIREFWQTLSITEKQQLLKSILDVTQRRITGPSADTPGDSTLMNQVFGQLIMSAFGNDSLTKTEIYKLRRLAETNMGMRNTPVYGARNYRILDDGNLGLVLSLIAPGIIANYPEYFAELAAMAKTGTFGTIVMPDITDEDILINAKILDWFDIVPTSPED